MSLAELLASRVLASSDGTCAQPPCDGVCWSLRGSARCSAAAFVPCAKCWWCKAAAVLPDDVPDGAFQFMEVVGVDELTLAKHAVELFHDKAATVTSWLDVCLCPPVRLRTAGVVARQLRFLAHGPADTLLRTRILESVPSAHALWSVVGRAVGHVQGFAHCLEPSPVEKSTEKAVEDVLFCLATAAHTALDDQSWACFGDALSTLTNTLRHCGGTVTRHTLRMLHCLMELSGIAVGVPSLAQPQDPLTSDYWCSFVDRPYLIYLNESPVSSRDVIGWCRLSRLRESWWSRAGSSRDTRIALQQLFFSTAATNIASRFKLRVDSVQTGFHSPCTDKNHTANKPLSPSHTRYMHHVVGGVLEFLEENVQQRSWMQKDTLFLKEAVKRVAWFGVLVSTSTRQEIEKVVKRCGNAYNTAAGSLAALYYLVTGCEYPVPCALNLEQDVSERLADVPCRNGEQDVYGACDNVVVSHVPFDEYLFLAARSAVQSSMAVSPALEMSVSMYGSLRYVELIVCGQLCPFRVSTGCTLDTLLATFVGSGVFEEYSWNIVLELCTGEAVNLGLCATNLSIVTMSAKHHSNLERVKVSTKCGSELLLPFAYPTVVESLLYNGTMTDSEDSSSTN